MGGSSPARTCHSTTAHCPPVCSPTTFNSALEPSPYVTVRPSCGPARTGSVKAMAKTPYVIAEDKMGCFYPNSIDSCPRLYRRRTQAQDRHSSGNPVRRSHHLLGIVVPVGQR